MKRHKINNLSVVIFILAVLVAMLIWSGLEGQGNLAKALQVQTVPVGLLRYGEMGEILRKLKLVTFAANDHSRYHKTDKKDEDFHTITFQKKRQVDNYLYTSNPGRKVLYQSTVIARTVEQKKDWPVLSLVVAEKDLNDSQIGILANRDKKGSDWEKIVQVSYLENGKVLFETHGGIRMHGGKRLITGEWQPGFKLYFRKKYGLKRVPEGLILPDIEVPLRTLVLQTTVWPPGHPMNNPLAYDIAREIDCKVPSTRLVEVYLNGRSYGMHFAVEHLSRRQWGQRFAHDNYNFYKFRNDNSHADYKMYFRQFWPIVTEKRQLTREIAGSRIDLDNFSRHIFSWVFCGTEDYAQGVAIYDNEDPEAKVSWINWDMDHSFFDHFATTYKVDRENWQQAAFELVYKDEHFSGRTKLFSRLMREDEDFHRQFVDLIVQLLNHRLTRNFLHERVEYYRQMMEKFGEPHEEYVTMLRKFMDHRPEFIYRDMQKNFALSTPYTCGIRVPENEKIAVDGYTYEKDYRGMYFTTTPVHITVTDTGRSRFQYWLVNGERILTPELQLSLQEDTDVSLVLGVPEISTGRAAAADGGSL